MGYQKVLSNLSWKRNSFDRNAKLGHILVVDDDEGMRMVLSSILNKHFEVTALEDGREALLWLQSRNLPDLIITDINMPNINGLELVQNLKASALFQKIPVVVISGYTLQDRISLMLSSYHIHDYLIKPFNPELVLNCILEAHRMVKS